MKKNRLFRSIQLLILLSILLFFSRTYAQEPLQSGIPVDTSLSEFTYRNYYIDVPSGAIRLTATISNGKGDLDLFIKFNNPLSGESYQELIDNSDFRSDVLNTADESILITSQDSPPLQEGRWYVVPANFNDTETSFTMTVTFEISAGGGGETSDPSGDGTARLNLVANDSFLVAWGRARLAYEIKAFKSGTLADLYVALLLNNGSLVFLKSNYSTSTSETPFARNILIVDGEYVIFDVDLPGEQLHDTVYMGTVLTKAGTSVFNFSNWISNFSYVLFTFNSTSSDQYKLLAERGNPFFMRIEFIRDRKIKKESWIYPGSQTYTFYNGALQSFPNEVVPASAGEPQGKPVNLDEILLYPTTTIEEVRNKYGDPDRVLDNLGPGIKIWVFHQAGIKITTRDGLISVIEVY